MVRPLFVLGLVLASLTPVLAQDAAPAAPAAPAAAAKGNIGDILTGLYATRAVIEICTVTVDPTIAAAMQADQIKYEQQLGYDPGTAAKAYDDIKTSVTGTKPDCTDGSADRKGVDTVLALYKK